MRAHCRAFDWASTPLGPVSGWSPSLRAIVRMVLASRNPMFLWWGPELVQFYNDAYRPSLGEGGRHPRALGMRAREFWTDIWDAIGPQIEQVMGGGDATWHEDQYLPIERNGRLEDVWWTYSYSPVHEDDGSVAGTLVVCQETTTRVLAETALRESEARYRTLFESLDEGFCVIEVIFDAGDRPVDYRFLEANPAFVQQTGLVNALGKTIRDLAPEHEKHWFETYGRVAVTGEPIRFEARAEALGRWYDVYAFRVGREEERRVAVLFRDVSAARAAEAERDRLLRALEVERSRLAYVFEQAPAFLAVLRGPEHVFELVNSAYYQVVGHRELVGKPVLDALPEVRNQGFGELLDGVLATGEPFVGREIPVLLARTPGAPPEERFVNFVYLPLIEGDGTRAGVIAHGTDVTEQVRSRKEVERLFTLEQQARAAAEKAYREAETANRAKGEFLAVMSHELRTPLNAIGGYAELLEMGIRGPVTPHQAEDLRRIQTSQRHLLGLINEVLNYAKLETGVVHYDVSNVRVRDALSSAEALVAPQARHKGLTLAVDDAPLERAVRADPEKLQQILVNLLSNAVKFTDRGGCVELFCTIDGSTIALHVRDSGIGIPADKLDVIFDPFVQVRADLTRTHEGTGLGLAISRDLARGMGGDLVVASTSGEGSTFTLRLPEA
jgi:PAS domain S-box-containing protein